MALVKRKNSKYWWLDFEFEGRRHQLSTKCTNKRDAEKFAAAYRTQLANDKVDLKPKKHEIPTFEQAAKDFLGWSQKSQKESTYRRYETSSKATVKFFGSRRVSEIDRDDLERFVAWRQNQKKKPPVRKLQKNKQARSKKEIKPATINRELAFLRIVFNRLIDRNIVVKNPASRFKFLPENNEQMRVLTEKEIKIYLMACSQPLQDVALLMLETGMRPSEVCDLKKSDVNFEQGYIQILSGKTKSARRRLPMSEAARRVLESRIEKSPNDYLFAGGKNGKSEKPIIKLNNAHNGAVARAKLKPFRLYDLRHTFATRACEAGIDLVTVKDLLGHARLEMVLRYSHPTEKHRFEAIRKLEAYRKAS